ncbi:MAG: 50S ribosomal protein L24 [Thiobacillus sp.]|nr:50S ribosomal protein L24 [Thiobacillus sp.]MDO9386022.1 50S ribosomal protein L24 [Thiobacillus sp.]
MARIRRSDQVVVLTGKDKGKRSVVLKVFDNDHLLVEGVNRVKKHQKPNPMRNIQGGIVEKEMPIQASNVALFNVGTQKADRVGYKVLEDGRKVRVYKSNGEMVDAQG